MDHKDKISATPESVWAVIGEIAASHKELSAIQKELAASQKETEGLFRENAREIADTTRQIKELKEMMGGMGKSNGMFAEEFFINTIKSSDKNLFGEQFHEIISTTKRYIKDKKKRGEQDVLLVNCQSVAIVEIKYRARIEDVKKLLDRPTHFKDLYPQYQTHRIYLGLAAMSFDKDVEEETLKNGIAIIKQDGDMVVISDEQFSVF